MIWPFNRKRKAKVQELHAPPPVLTHDEARAALRERANKDRGASQEHVWGPLETLTDYYPVNGVHPIGHRCQVHPHCALNVRLPEVKREVQESSFDYDPVRPGGVLVLPVMPAVEADDVTTPTAFQGFGGGDSGGGGASDDWTAPAIPAPESTPSCDTSYSAPDPSPSFDSGTCDTSSSFDSGSSSFDS